MNKSGSQKSKSPSQLIDARIKELGDWRGKMLNRCRTLIRTGETYKSVMKMALAIKHFPRISVGQ